MEQSMFFLQISILFVVYNVPVSDQRCLSYAEGGKCKDCIPGYFGIDCSFSCRYPNYGQGCQEVCKCHQTACHAIRGCPKEAAVIVTSVEINKARISPNWYVTKPRSVLSTSYRRKVYDDKRKHLTTTPSIDLDKSNWRTQEVSKPIGKTPDIFTKQTSVLSTFENPVTVSLITGVLFLSLVVFVLLWKKYHKTGCNISFNNDENHPHCIYYPKIDVSLRQTDNNHEHSNQIGSEIAANASPYETIELYLDDSSAPLTSNLPNRIKDHQKGDCHSKSETKLVEDADRNEYLCPTSAIRSSKLSDEKTVDDTYLTVF